MKKVILILIDSLMQTDLENAIATGKAPALKFLMDHGVYQEECVTAFPTMTATVDATLMTGVYPEQHKIPGLIWYNPKEKRIIDYVNGSKTVLKLGIKSTAEDVLINLNEKHLSKEVKTIFEELSDNGRTSASINFIIHRGNTEHLLKPPFLLNLVTRFAFYKRKITGPEVLSIGALYKPSFPGRSIYWGLNQTVFKQFGINDDFAVQVTSTTIASGRQPDFMAIYLPDHDHYLHKYIDKPLKSLEKVDHKITQILNIFGSWERAIDQNIFIIIGDHGQTAIGKGEEHNIDLDSMLKPYKTVQIGQKANEENEVVFANNERMVYIYPLKKDKQQQIKDTLLTDERIDFIAWKQGDKIIVENHQGWKLKFSRNGQFIDPYNVKWHLKGNFEILDLKIDDDKNLIFNQYPDALSRLYGSLFSQRDFVIAASAKPSFEFISESFPTHLGGGSHGSLHRIDSVVPLLIAGANNNPSPVSRIVDLKQYILQLLNVTSTITG